MKNHFVKVCRKKAIANQRNIREIQQNGENCQEQEVTFGINKITSKKIPKINIKVNGVATSVLVDTGSSLNIIDSKLIRKMKPVPEMKRTNTKAQ